MYSKYLTILEVVSFVILATCSLPTGSRSVNTVLQKVLVFYQREGETTLTICNGHTHIHRYSAPDGTHTLIRTHTSTGTQMHNHICTNIHTYTTHVHSLITCTYVITNSTKNDKCVGECALEAALRPHASMSFFPHN